MDDIFATKPKASASHVPALKAKPLPAPVAVETPKPVAPVHTQPPVIEKAPSARGRPIVHTDGWQKCTVVLLNYQKKWLKNLEHAVYTNTDKTISRAEIIRAMIDAVIESDLDLSHITSEEEAKKLILTHMKK